MTQIRLESTFGVGERHQNNSTKGNLYHHYIYLQNMGVYNKMI